MANAKPATEAGQSLFLFRPLRQAPRLVPRQSARTRRSAARTARRPARRNSPQAIDLTREVLQVPADYRIGIVPASDTGAVEMAMWSLLGARPVDMLAWESFGEGWVTDVAKQLKLKDARVIKSGYGELPDLAKREFRS